jgi:pimeloyl-ACP methyl ester carboxylesterase
MFKNLKLHRRRILLFATPVLLIPVFYWAFWFLLPLQASELTNRWEMWREGVTEVESGGLHGYLHDTCQHSPSKSCSCVVMIHGLADNAMTWKKILLWPEKGWPEPVKLYAFDLPGSGKSSVPPDVTGYRVRKQAEKLKEALAPLCGKWVVVGNSLGGWIAAWLALDWPDGVTRLLLADSAGLKNEEDDKDLHSFFSEPTVESLKEFQKRAYYQGRPLPERVWQAVVERMKRSNARQVIAAQTPEDFLDARLPTLRRPTMLLWGEADRITPLSSGLQMKSLIPGGIWQPAPLCGHLPQKECPLEVIKAIHSLIIYGAV